MAAVASRHQTSYSTPKTLPITMPTKAPTYRYPVSRVAVSPPEYSDSSTTYSGSRHSAGSFSAKSSSYTPSQSSDYDSCHSTAGVDVMDMLSERMNTAFDPIAMDRSLARQTQISGDLNAKQRDLAELQALAQRRLKGARVKLVDTVAQGREARADLKYCESKLERHHKTASRKHPEAYEKARRSRHERDC